MKPRLGIFCRQPSQPDSSPKKTQLGGWCKLSLLPTNKVNIILYAVTENFLRSSKVQENSPKIKYLYGSPGRERA